MLKLARQFVSAGYLEHASPQLTFHNMALSQKLVQRIKELGVNHFPDDVVEGAQVAALFSQLGYAYDYDRPVETSGNLLYQFLEETSLANEAKKNILDCLIPNQVASSSVVSLYQDAWNSLVLGDGLETYMSLYRTELQLMRDEPVSKATIRGWFYSQLKQAQLHTDLAKAKYQTILSENLANLDRQTNKKLAKQVAATELFGGITQASPSREVQTFFRTSFEYHTKLIGISDNKARIMISVNSILVSVLLSLLTYNYQKVASIVNPMVIVPILIFLIAAVGSLIFAILSSRPNLPSGQGNETERLFSFMDFVKLGKSEYQKQLDSMLRDGSSILASMSSALYYLGGILDRKYKYLTTSYNIFMVGFVVSVLMFVVVYFV